MSWGGIARLLFTAGLAIALGAFGGTGGGEDPRCANLNRHQLHDVVQLAGRVLPDHMPHSRHGADGSRHDRKQCHSEHGLPAQLHDPANQLPGALRTDFAVAVALRAK
jgi:hypothetical protein